MAQTNKFFRNCIDFEHADGATAPSSDATPTTTKSAQYSHSLNSPATGNLMMVYVPYATRPCIYVYAWAEGPTPRWCLWRILNTDYDLQDGYRKMRLAAGGVRLISNTRSTDTTTLNGSFDAIESIDMPDLTTLGLDDLLQNSYNSKNQVSQITTEEGIVLVAFPYGDYKLKQPLARWLGIDVYGTADSFIDRESEFEPVTTFYGTDDNGFAPAGTTLPQNIATTIFDSNSSSAPTPSNWIGRQRVRGEVTVAGSATALARVAVNVIVFYTTSDDSFNQVGHTTAISTTTMVTAALAANTIQFDSGFFESPGPIDQMIVSVLNTGVVAATFLGGKTEWLFRDVQSTEFSPALMAVVKNVQAGQQIGVSGKQNYEVVPDTKLARNVKSFSHPGNPLDVTIASYAVHNDPMITSVSSTTEYRRMQGQAGALSTYEYAHEAYAADWSGLGGLLKGLLPMAPMIASMINPALGPVVGGIASAISPLLSADARQRASDARVKGGIKYHSADATGDDILGSFSTSIASDEKPDVTVKLKVTAVAERKGDRTVKVRALKKDAIVVVTAPPLGKGAPPAKPGTYIVNYNSADAQGDDILGDMEEPRCICEQPQLEETTCKCNSPSAKRGIVVVPTKKMSNGATLYGLQKETYLGTHPIPFTIFHENDDDYEHAKEEIFAWLCLTNDQVAAISTYSDSGFKTTVLVLAPGVDVQPAVDWVKISSPIFNDVLRSNIVKAKKPKAKFTSSDNDDGGLLGVMPDLDDESEEPEPPQVNEAAVLNHIDDKQAFAGSGKFYELTAPSKMLGGHAAAMMDYVREPANLHLINRSAAFYIVDAAGKKVSHQVLAATLLPVTRGLVPVLYNKHVVKDVEVNVDAHLRDTSPDVFAETLFMSFARDTTRKVFLTIRDREITDVGGHSWTAAAIAAMNCFGGQVVWTGAPSVAPGMLGLKILHAATNNQQLLIVGVPTSSLAKLDPIKVIIERGKPGIFKPCTVRAGDALYAPGGLPAAAVVVGTDNFREAMFKCAFFAAQASQTSAGRVQRTVGAGQVDWVDDPEKARSISTKSGAFYVETRAKLMKWLKEPAVVGKGQPAMTNKDKLKLIQENAVANGQGTPFTNDKLISAFASGGVKLENIKKTIAQFETKTAQKKPKKATERSTAMGALISDLADLDL